LKLLIAGAALQSTWGGGEPIVAAELVGGLSARGFDTTSMPTGRSALQLASMAVSPQDWDALSYLRYSKRLDELEPDCVLGFYDYDSNLVRACASRQIPFVASIHIYWPVCPVGTLYIDGVGICTSPGLTKCLRHMSGAIPPTRLPLGISWMPAPLGLGIYLKTRSRVAELRHAAAVIVPSRRIRDILQGFGLPHVTAVENGLSLERIPAKLWSGGPKRILFASGATSERKGFQHFMQLAQKFSAAPEKPEFVATSFGGAGPVVGLGRLAHEDVLKEMRGAYAVVAPSLWEEPFSVTIQEAMCSGKAVVAYDVGGNSELLGDAGVTVPCGDLDALHQALQDLLSNETNAIRLGERARARAEALFRSDRMIDGYAKILRDVTESGGTSSA
jgi:glycosyltransferase involved in cell wall biosynthesis